MKRWACLAASMFVTAAEPARAADALADGSLVGACIMAAANLYSLPPETLVILLNVENGKVGKISPNKNKTFDIGPMQVNNSWIGKLAAHWRATPQAAYLALRDNFCANIEGGAWILRQGLDEADGDLWEGIALYHSHTEEHKRAYLRNVLAHAQRLRKQAAAELAETDGLQGR